MSALFSLDEKAVTFGTTPVDNQFILEYMAGAKGDYIKVYLYGLFHCTYPQADDSLEQMVHDLDLTENEIKSAYRYWERIGLVTRISDNPPTWRYISPNQRALMGNMAPVDRDYESFCESLYQLFGSARDLESKELSLAYEWKADMGLPMEVILMMINYLISMRGTNFSFGVAQKLAVSLVNENVHTIDDAEKLLGREKRIYEGSKKLIRRLGKRRDPSEDEQALYKKWTDEWGFSHDAIEAACAETTKGEPTFGYLDGILNGMMRRAGKSMSSAREVEETRSADQQRRAPLRALLDTMGLRDIAINDGTLKVYDAFRELYPDDVILLAGRECSRMRNANLETVQDMLSSWKNHGLRDLTEITAYIEGFHLMSQRLRELSTLWGIRYNPSTGNREMLDRWLNQLHLPWEEILRRAADAKQAEHPMKYLNALLDPATPAPEKKQSGRGPKTVTEQQYSQRSYENDEGRLPDWMAAALEAENQHEK